MSKTSKSESEMLKFTGERIVPQADNCEPTFADKMFQEHIARYAFASQWTKGKSVLDVGCGVGYGSSWLAQADAARVVAFDISENAIKHAMQFYAHPNVEFHVASATDFVFQEKFDVITCFELIEHVEEQEAVIDCIHRALKDEGVLIISTPRALEQKRTHFHTREFSLNEFRSLLERRFAGVQFFFENNHFASLITDRTPGIIDNVIPLNEQYTLGQADYFIAVVTKSPEVKHQVQPILVLNDDKYVSLLENDVGILHKAEDGLKAQLSDQNEMALQTRAKIEALHRELEFERGELRYAQDVVFHMQASKSWKLTAPLRAVSRRVKYPLRLTRKVASYWRQHGTHALIGAVSRRLMRSTIRTQYHGLLHEALPQLQSSATIANMQFDVLMAIGCWEGESKRYRVYNIAEGLSSLGYKVHVMPFSEIAKIAQGNVKARVIVLFRAPFEPSLGIKELLTYAKVRGIKVIYDVDDLVFDPSVIDQIDGVKLLKENERSQYVDGVHKYRQLMLQCDWITVPTEFLRCKVEEIGKNAIVLQNSINFEQLQIAEEILSQPPQQQEVVRIGYFSGSRTHQLDFRQCEQALLNIMERYPHAIFRIVGYLDLDSYWDRFATRIERIDFQPYQVMMRLLAEVDINIAPLDIGSVFCQGKSELKFFEAGLLCIPTIASATDTFLRAIDHGINGYCVHTKDEWVECLDQLVGSKELRMQIGTAARIRALEYFNIRHVAQVAADIYELGKAAYTPIEPHTENPLDVQSRLRISWVIPGLIIGGGGHRNILRAAYFLKQFGHHITLYFTGTEQDPQKLKEQINKHFYPFDCPIYLFDGTIHPTDVVFATHWSTVEAALKGRNVAKEVMYFVQDFEPAFSAMGSEYVLAENTYRLGLYHITSGPWCEVILKRDFKAEADHFRFPVDRSIYYPRRRTCESKNLIFFAKPEMPRRCFELGIMALREFHKLRPDVEIIMFGSPHASKQHYGFPATIRDIVPTLDDLAQMYSNGDIGLVFSTTNPSLIPYEMMACGLPVVDLDRGDNAVNYGNRSDIALLANPLPEKMAIEIATLIGNPYELEKRREAGLKFVEEFPSEEEMARRIECLILARVNSKTEC